VLLGCDASGPASLTSEPQPELLWALFLLALAWLVPGLLVAGLWSLFGWASLYRRPAST